MRRKGLGVRGKGSAVAQCFFLAACIIGSSRDPLHDVSFSLPVSSACLPLLCWHRRLSLPRKMFVRSIPPAMEAAA